MSTLTEIIDARGFAITCELTPPKGVNLEPLKHMVTRLKPCVDAINLTDSHRAKMSMAPIGAAKPLIDAGVSPIVQMTGRDRNQIGLQADLLAASSMGVENVLCMSGDTPSQGDHPDAKGVFDLDAFGLLRAVEVLNQGQDLGGSKLLGTPKLCAGAVANPGALELDTEIDRLNRKLEAGARFIQTQPIFDSKSFEIFSSRLKNSSVPILAGVIVIKSVKMATMLNSVPGIMVPDAIISRLASSKNLKITSSKIAAEVISNLLGLTKGVHIMAIGWEDQIPPILERVGIPERT